MATQKDSEDLMDRLIDMNGTLKALDERTRNMETGISEVKAAIKEGERESAERWKELSTTLTGIDNRIRDNREKIKYVLYPTAGTVAVFLGAALFKGVPWVVSWFLSLMP